MKKVYLIANYFHFPTEKKSNRFCELAMMLANDEAIELEVITSHFYQRNYTYRENLDELRAQVPFKVTFVEESSYCKSVSLKRLRACQVFGKNVLKYIKSQPLPDLIYQAIPTLDVAYKVEKFAKKNHIPFVIDIQDLWPEAFKMALNIPVVSDLAFLPYTLESKSVYKKADAICAVSKTYTNRALRENPSCKEVHPVFIGINLQKFDDAARNNSVSKSNGITLAYCGSLAKSYDIEYVIDALSLMDEPPYFLLMGDGNDKEKFEVYAKRKGVQAEFTGFLPYEQMCGRLCACDMTINPIISTSEASIINKHGDYCACGLPVLNTQRSQEYCDLVEEYNMGYNILSGNPQELADMIQKLMDDEALRLEMGKNARRCAVEKFDRRTTYRELVDTVKRLL